MAAYYNEKDPFAAAWLRNLIAANMIAPGDVDERSIENVVPLELTKYVQCHFFAGIGVWSYAMRRAGWPDDRQGWSGSCPCQPFSQAGQGSGFDDERHLWPAFFHLIEQCRPAIVVGEQVASPDGLAWLDLVQSDMEGTNYAFGTIDQCAASFGAPHIRQRLYWVADDYESQRRRFTDTQKLVVNGSTRGWQQSNGVTQHDSTIGGLANNSAGLAQQRSNGTLPCGSLVAFPWQSSERSGTPVSGVGNTNSNGTGRQRGGVCSKIGREDRQSSSYDVGTSSSIDTRRGPTNGYWRAADWLRCKDERWRPVEPSSFPLAHGVANRMGLLRGYGNAINAPQAEEFIKVVMQYAP